MDALGPQFYALSSEAHFTKTLIKVSPLNSGDPWIREGWQGSKKPKFKSFEPDYQISSGLEEEKFWMIKQSFDSAEMLDHKMFPNASSASVLVLCHTCKQITTSH